MRLIKTIKAQVYTAVTKDELMRWVTYGKYYTVMNHGGSWFRGYVDEKYKYAMNFEKRKKKTSRSLLYGNVVTQEKSWT
ncbi:MAG: hypothetical protein HQ521_06055, partial [Bacteroidetes bacterium]|nr:hypothetical protein [Bacteroidota bacterium]